MANAVDRPMDLQPFQWAQMMAFALEFAPDCILELGRGAGNSTCAFTEVANQLKPYHCRVVSLDISSLWEQQTLPKLRRIVPASWFQPLQILQADILNFDYQQALAEAGRILVFWDAHGYDIAECVLGKILPEIAGRPHVVIMHDLTDARYVHKAHFQYGEHGLWKGNNWNGARLMIDHILTSVEQAVAITDFAARNKLPLHSAADSFHTELTPETVIELKESLGEGLFSLNAHWFWFSLNEISGPYTFPVFHPAAKVKSSLKTRFKIALKVLLNQYPAERFLA